MGGPFWARKDEGAWSIPKGEHPPRRTPAPRPAASSPRSSAPPRPRASCATSAPSGPAARSIAAFALAGDLDAEHVVSNTFELEWPPRSGRTQAFPEVDRAAWFDLDTARRKIVKSQLPVLGSDLTVRSRRSDRRYRRDTIELRFRGAGAAADHHVVRRARHDRSPRPLHALRPQARGGRVRRPVLALPARPALRRARPARRPRATGPLGGETADGAARRTRSPVQASTRCASGSPRPRPSTSSSATSPSSSCSSTSSASPSTSRH